MTSTHAPRMFIGAVVASLVLLFAGVASASAAGPRLVSPKKGATLKLLTEPTFKVKDTSRAARKYGIFVTISQSKKTSRKSGDLKRTKVGVFRSMKRKGTTFTYTAEDYSFDTWYMAKPGKYYWQAYHIDCSARPKSCDIHSKIGSFKVQ